MLQRTRQQQQRLQQHVCRVPQAREKQILKVKKKARDKGHDSPALWRMGGGGYALLQNGLILQLYKRSKTVELGLSQKPLKPWSLTFSHERHRARSIQMVKLNVMRKWTSAQYLERISTQIFDGLVQIDSSNLYIIKT